MWMDPVQQQHLASSLRCLCGGAVLAVLLLAQAWTHGSWVCAVVTDQDVADFYSFNVTDISGNMVSLEKYRGMVTLVVNVASQCGYTVGHYRAMVSIQQHFAQTNKFSILAFPCDQFGQQEPGTNEDILEFARNKMGTNFPLFAKIDVLDQSASPAWTNLIRQSGQSPTWNFWKYLVDHNGRVINSWGPSISPDLLFEEINEAINSIEVSTGSNIGTEASKEEF